MTPLINQALSLVYTQLSYFSESSNYYQVLSTAFGNNYDRDIAEKLKLHWQQVNFTQIPQIEILDGGILGSAYGAYARETNKIYLSRNFVTNNTAEVIGRVILEEVGHFVDGQLNVEDSEGDEGAIFAELVVGNSLDDQALRKLRTESDFGIITLNGQQVDVEQSGNLPGVYYSSVAWADYNADGKQDFLLTGYSSDFTPIAKLYKNTGNGFKDDTSVSLPGVAASSVAWADYDGDGNQDFLLTGYSSDFTPIAKLYKNTGNGFKEDTSVSLPGVAASSVAWADYDGDGKQDFLLTGSSSSGDIAKLYRNTGNGFKEDTNVSIPGVGVGSVAWADYDGDGNQDFLLTGSSSSGDIAKLYRNTGNGFKEDTNVSIPGVGVGSVAWADYDGDGNQDFLLTGLDGSKPITLLVRSKEIFSDVTLAVSLNSVAEDGNDKLFYTFTRTGVISNALTVNYTIGGTANKGSDYGSIGTSVTFAAGSSTATVTVDPTADTTVESDETVILTLASGTGYTIGTTSGVTGTITNDDTQVTLAVSPTTVTEDGTPNLVYTFTRTGVISNALTVNYTIGGTANKGSDYGSIGTSVTFAAGSSTATVTVDPTPDTTVESDETVILTLDSGTGYTIGTTSGVTGT
ncbi:FG-GAP-like repeat-containing protein, partial [Cylindrospermopsis raciborskii]|uniref:FG-GAP-like repeat-containing protein n=1 Tax=Cylindrospermopsis raciborskii TaxID=77022 RepID=UPI000AE247C9